MIYADFLINLRDWFGNNKVPVRWEANPTTDIFRTITFNNGEYISVTKEERSVLITDIVGFSKKDMVEQLILVETMNAVIKKSLKQVESKFSRWEKWKIYKGSGDGAIFVFGNLRAPASVGHALQFATQAMKVIIDHNNNLPSDALNCLNVRMALAYGEIFETEDLDGSKDVIGEAINVAARLASVKEAKTNSIFISNEVYRNLQINKKAYFLNDNDSIPEAGDFGEFIIGKIPDTSNFLYIVRKGVFETKDRLVEAFNVSGRLEGTDIKES